MWLFILVIVIVILIIIVTLAIALKSMRTKYAVNAPIVGKSYRQRRMGASNMKNGVLEMTSLGYMVQKRVPPANQRTCNACWAIATTQAMSDRLRLKGEISIMDQLNYYAFHDRISVETHGDDNCINGAFIETGLNKSVEEGAPLMSESRDRGFNDTIDPSDLNAPMYKAKGWTKIVGIDAIKRELRNNGTVVAVINLYESFGNFTGSGIYQPLPREHDDPSMAHMVTIVGYDDRDSTWIIRNSYGTSSGDGGYVKLRQGDPRMGTENDVYAPII